MIWLVAGWMVVGGFTLATAYRGAPPSRRTFKHNIKREFACIFLWPAIWVQVWQKMRHR